MGGFLKTPRKEEDGPESKALKKAFDRFDLNKDGAMNIMEFSKLLVATPGEAPPLKQICKFFNKLDSDANLTLDFGEFTRMASALKQGKLPGIGPIDVVTMKRPSPSEMLEQSTQDMPKSIQKMLNSVDEEK